MVTVSATASTTSWVISMVIKTQAMVSEDKSATICGVIIPCMCQYVVTMDTS